MDSLVIFDRSGNKHDVEAIVDLSVMELIRNSGLDEIQALCGGCCSCATCHVYVDTALTSTLPSLSPDEDELLDNSKHRKPNSRLSCQITYNKTLNGMRIEIAPED